MDIKKGVVAEAAATNAPILLTVLLSFALMIVALIKAVEITKKLSGEAGAMVTKFGMMGAGLLAGGGVGMLGRRLVGGGMAKYLNAEDASGKSRRARMAEGDLHREWLLAVCVARNEQVGMFQTCRVLLSLA